MPSTSVKISQTSASSAAARATAVVSEPPRPSVVISFVVRLMPWNPATIAMCPLSRAVRMRCGSTSMIRALPWMPSVIMPAWEPVKDWAEAPNLLMAMASSAMEMRSPAERSMSISRAGAESVTWPARSRSSSVVSPMAETTTTTSSPAFWASTTRRATRLMPSASATEEPPNFFTTRCLVAAAETGSVCGCDPGWTSVVGKLIRAPSLDHRGSGPGNQTARRRNFSPQFIAVPPAPLNCDRMADTPGLSPPDMPRAAGQEWTCSPVPRDMLILGGQEWA